MAETHRLISALDNANYELSRILAVDEVQERTLKLSSVCSPVAAALRAVGAGTASYEATVASLLENSVVCKLVKVLRGTLRALGECFAATEGLQVTWELALVFLYDVITDCSADGSEDLWQECITQLLHAGTSTTGMYARLSSGFGRFRLGGWQMLIILCQAGNVTLSRT
jgi:hypothetical protein